MAGSSKQRGARPRGKARKPRTSQRKLSPAEQQLADRAASNRAAWARRHPRAAAAERQLRKARKAALDAFDHKQQGTIETHAHAARQNQGALARLYRSGAIDVHQLAAADQIRSIVQALVAGVAVRTASLETRVDTSRNCETFFELLGQVRGEVAYTRWRGAIERPGPVMEMIIGETPAGDPVPFTIVAKRYRMHNRRAKKLLIDALDLWPRILGQACREIDDATLAAAHAGIL